MGAFAAHGSSFYSSLPHYTIFFVLEQYVKTKKEHFFPRGEKENRLLDDL